MNKISSFLNKAARFCFGILAAVVFIFTFFGAVFITINLFGEDDSFIYRLSGDNFIEAITLLFVFSISFFALKYALVLLDIKNMVMEYKSKMKETQDLRHRNLSKSKSAFKDLLFAFNYNKYKVHKKLAEYNDFSGFNSSLNKSEVALLRNLENRIFECNDLRYLNDLDLHGDKDSFDKFKKRFLFRNMQLERVELVKIAIAIQIIRRCFDKFDFDRILEEESYAILSWIEYLNDIFIKDKELISSITLNVSSFSHPNYILNDPSYESTIMRLIRIKDLFGDDLASFDFNKLELRLSENRDVIRLKIDQLKKKYDRKFSEIESKYGLLVLKSFQSKKACIGMPNVLVKDLLGKEFDVKETKLSSGAIKKTAFYVRKMGKRGGISYKYKINYIDGIVDKISS